jgi:hypothetical protein
VIEAQSYKSDGGRWRPKAVVSIHEGGNVRIRPLTSFKEMRDTEADANTYALAMAKKWIDDEG